MRITDYLKKEDIKVYLEGKNKDEIIEEMVQMLVKTHPEVKVKDVMGLVLERESLETTGIGEGVAIPHARVDKLEDICVGVGLVKEDVDFGSLDNKPVKIIFLILYPAEHISMQIRFLARVSRLLHVEGLKAKLCESLSSKDIFETLKQYEDTHLH